MVGTVPQKNSEEVIGRNSPTKKIVKRLFVGTVPQKREEIIGRNSPTNKVVKRLLVGTVPQKREEVIGRNSPTKKNSEEGIGS